MFHCDVIILFSSVEGVIIIYVSVKDVFSVGNVIILYVSVEDEQKIYFRRA